MIVVCGEALIDLFVMPDGAGGLRAEPVAGGSPFNVALGLARLGTPVSYLGGLSTDSFGGFLAARLEREGVDLRLAPRLPQPATLVIVSTDARGVPTYRFIGEGAADRALIPAHLPAALPAEVKAITFGSLSMGVEPVGSTLLGLARRESGQRVVSIDPNLRASVVGDLVSWRQRLGDFIATATIVKASEEDITGTYGASASIPEIAASWQRLGPSLVVVTRGEAGAVAFHAGAAYDIPGRTVKVIDTVGAGDTFHAALLSQLARIGALTRDHVRALAADKVRDVLTFAVAASAITCSRRGADLPRRGDVETLLPRTT